MNKVERLKATIVGEEVDRPPIALWRHWPVDDQDPSALARATVEFQRRYDFDFIKVTPASSFCIRDWGATDCWEGHFHGTRTYGDRVVGDISDWSRIVPRSPYEGHLAKQLEVLELIRDQVDDQRVPVIQTIFSPLSQAKNLVGQEALLQHLRQAPEEVEKALQNILIATQDFVNAAIKLGIDGIFYAVQFAQPQLLTSGEYDRFGRSYDLPILANARGGWLNVLHLHGAPVYFDKFVDYPVQVINWHDRETYPSLAQGLEMFPGAVCGGISQTEVLTLGNPQQVSAQVSDALDQTGGRRLIIGTGCVTPTTAPVGNLYAARSAVEM